MIRLGIGGSSIGSEINIDIISGYHSWVCHVGVIMMIEAWSCLILARHLPIRQNGGKAYAATPDHETMKASVAQYSESGFQLMNLGT